MLIFTIYGNTLKGKSTTRGKTIKGALNFFLSQKPPIHFQNTNQMDETACLRKQFKWNRFPFFGDRLSQEINHNFSRQRV